MRKKELKLVISFATTTDALEMEKICKDNGAGGRMIPVPRVISAGCGLAWAAEVSEKEELVRLMEKYHLQAEGIHACRI